MRRAARLGAALVSGVLVACAGGLPSPELPGARQAWAQAQREAAAQPERAEQVFEDFLRRFPRSALADDAGLALAQAQLAAGARIAATRTLQRVVQEHPGGDRSDPARLLLARLLADRGLAAQGYDVATGVRLSRLGGAERAAAHRLLADLAAESGDAVAQLRWLGLVRADVRGAEAAVVDRELDAAIGALGPAELVAAAEQLRGRPPGARVQLRIGALALTRGDREAAQRALAAARTLTLGPGDGERLADLERRLAGGRPSELLAMSGSADPAEAFGPLPARGVLGVALPLSGDFAPFGEQALKGLVLAAGLFRGPDDAGRSGLRLRVVDTAGRPEGAAAAVAELAAEPEILAVVGGLVGDAAEAAAEAAEQAGLPLLTLTTREGVSDGRTRVLRVGESPRLDAELVAAYATETLGLRRFAILYPDVDYGRALRAVFWDAVEARGGKIVGVARYAADATDYSAPVRRLIGYELLSWGALDAIRERERLRKRAKRLPPGQAAKLREEADAMLGPGDQPLPPFVDFDALFIPDTWESIGLIAPHLAFHEVRGVRLLGTSAWNDAELLRLGGRHVDGAVFPAGVRTGSARVHLAAFERRYRETFGELPGGLAATAFDAGQLAILALAQGARDRDGLLARIRERGRWEGVSGRLFLDASGRMKRRPHLLGVERGEVVSVDERGEPPHLRRVLPYCPTDRERVDERSRWFETEPVPVDTAGALEPNCRPRPTRESDAARVQPKRSSRG